jgi:hypothetical protein
MGFQNWSWEAAFLRRCVRAVPTPMSVPSALGELESHRSAFVFLSVFRCCIRAYHSAQMPYVATTASTNTQLIPRDTPNRLPSNATVSSHVRTSIRLQQHDSRNSGHILKKSCVQRVRSCRHVQWEACLDGVCPRPNFSCKCRIVAGGVHPAGCDNTYDWELPDDSNKHAFCGCA